ncbi:MAG: mandelate racemase [Hyphomicrobiales bacterium]|nr:MAG: mandelate racemase [Hyphomicrobiales bacterium]
MPGATSRSAPLEDLQASAFEIPTDRPEADGTLDWKSTTLVVVEIKGGGQVGLGYSYTSSAVLRLLRGALASAVSGYDAMDPPAAWLAMSAAIRNIGRDGLAATAISALDCAIWDLKAKLLGVPLALLFGRMRGKVPIYGSGGFTSYSDDELRLQLAGWVERDGCRWVKMKIGTDAERDPHRVQAAKSAIGDGTLFVDANGAYGIKQALALAARFQDIADVRWFEEPVSSDDLAGLAFLRGRAPEAMEVAAGEYGYDTDYFRRMLAAESVDVLQADVTRCTGYTGFLQVSALCEAHHIDLSAHCAPALHLPVACAALRLRHQEWFHDHVRIEHMLFDGAPRARNGMIEPDMGRPGHGLDFKRQDAERFRVS